VAEAPDICRHDAAARLFAFALGRCIFAPFNPNGRLRWRAWNSWRSRRLRLRQRRPLGRRVNRGIGCGKEDGPRNDAAHDVIDCGLRGIDSAMALTVKKADGGLYEATATPPHSTGRWSTTAPLPLRALIN